METTIIDKYYVAEIGRTTHGGRPIYANIFHGDEYSIEDASKWEEEEFLIETMKKLEPGKVYRVRYVEDTTVRVIT
ncbi:hypothetical protein ABLV98_05845 [Staphylococcus sp. 50Mo3-1]|jgi:hypothetical protein|uniref:hypothetical protein n=1 Tax=Staphylococcus TaxID=1279 RepID=UPI0033E8D6A7